MTERDKQVRKTVDKFVREFNEFYDTSMLCIYKINRKDDGISFAGDSEDMVRPFASIFKKAAECSECEGLTELVSAILCALNDVLSSEDDDTSTIYRSLLQSLLDGKFNTPEDEDYEDEDEEKEEDVEEHEETFEELKAKLNKMGYNVSKKPANHQKPNAKTKK